jgi:hypothetical protein
MLPGQVSVQVGAAGLLAVMVAVELLLAVLGSSVGLSTLALSLSVITAPFGRLVLT